MNETLQLLNEDEMDMLLYILNVIFPCEIPNTVIDKSSVVWYKKKVLADKLLRAFPRVLPEYHPVYSSLLTKFEIPHTINKN